MIKNKPFYFLKHALRQKKTILLVVVIMFIVCAFLSASPKKAVQQPAVPRVISYNGKIYELVEEKPQSHDQPQDQVKPPDLPKGPSPPSIEEMLSEELDLSLDQVENYKRNSDQSRANAVLFSLVRNSELEGMMYTVTEIERSFNSKYQYPYVFLNDVPFTDEFMTSIQSLTNASIEFGLIPEEHWSIPSWIDLDKFHQRLEELKKTGIPYMGSVSYRHMCRFNSGFFYKHPLMLKFDYYWRIEPEVDYPCNLSYDPFAFMQFTKKKYGFNIIGNEFQQTVEGLWAMTKLYSRTGPFLDLFGQGSYNGLHFWSNFEIGDLNWLRSKEYNNYFDHLDRSGGFFYQRWGDAPVHSIAAGLLLNFSDIHYFIDIGYRHSTSITCPVGDVIGSKKYNLDCNCNGTQSVGNARWAYRAWSKPMRKYLTYVRELRDKVDNQLD